MAAQYATVDERAGRVGWSCTAEVPYGLTALVLHASSSTLGAVARLLTRRTCVLAAAVCVKNVPRGAVVEHDEGLGGGDDGMLGIGEVIAH